MVMPMKISKLLAASLLACSMQTAVAEPKFPDDMKMADAIKNVIAQVNKSDYKEVSLLTTAGTITGEFVKQSGDVIIVKKKSGSMNLKHNKERVQYTLVNVNQVIGIEFSSLD